MVQPLFILGLVIVMLAQGMAVPQRDMLRWPGHGREMLFFALLRLILLPALALLMGRCLMRALEIGMLNGTGLVMAALAPPATAGMALAAVSGGSVLLLGRMAGLGTVFSFLVMPPLLAALVMHAPIEQGYAVVLLLAGLPFCIGLLLRQRAAGLEPRLAMLASVATGAMMLTSLLLGWDGETPALALAMALMLIAALAVTARGARLLRLPGDSVQSMVLTLLIPVVAMPIALVGGYFNVAAAAALLGIMGYALALLLVILRLRCNRA